MQAVIKSGSSQYLVSEGTEIDIDRLPVKSGRITFSEVMLLEDAGQVTVGTPHISGSRVEAEIVKEVKGEKIRVYKYKAKSRYRRHIGFRTKLIRIKIISIHPPGASVSVPAVSPKTSPVKPKPVKRAVKSGVKSAKSKTPS